MPESLSNTPNGFSQGVSIGQMLEVWKLSLRRWCSDGSLVAAAQQALRLDSEPVQLSGLVSCWGRGQFEALPPIRLLPGTTMPAAAGAYGLTTGTIYLNSDWLAQTSQEQGIAVLTEELGHHLDCLLNPVETPGDEGEHFSLLLSQGSIPSERMKAIHAEDDHSTILVDGSWIAVEQSTINGTPGNDNLVGTSGNDTVNSGRGQDVVDGDSGDDLLIVDYSGISLLSNGLNFSISNPDGVSHYGSGSVPSSGYSIVDSISFSNIERFLITGTERGDNITTGDGNDTIRGGAGNDIINAGAGVNSVDGGEGFDTLSADFSAATAGLSINNVSSSVVLPLGTGAVSSIEAFSNLSTGSGDDTIDFSTRGNDSVSTNGGNDTIDAGLGQDNVDGGGGDDLLIVDYSGISLLSNGLNFSISNPGGVSHYGSGTVSSNGYSIVDSISFGNIERFLISGTGLNDTITTGDGNDTINGGAGDDFINAGAGVNSVDGGEGFDILANADFSAATAGLSINNVSSSVVLPLGTGAAISIEAFQNLSTGSGDDTIDFSTRGNDSVSTNGGNDTIDAGLGVDNVDGGGGDDLLIVDYSGISLLSNGLNFSISNPGGVSHYGSGNVSSNGYSMVDSISFGNIERFLISGTGLNDTISTGDGNDTINSGAGDDVINAGAGVNSVDGGEGFDTLANADFSAATAGLSINNVSSSIVLPLATGAAINIEAFQNLSTGSGDDTIDFSTRGNDSVSTNGGNDTIDAGLGQDNVDGGGGDDLLIVDYSIISSLTSGLTFGITNPGGISHSGFGNVSSNSASIVDSISFGNIERFLISGTELDDNITTGDGNDTIRGGAGNDFINAGAGATSVDGGEGFDALSADFSAATAGLSINNVSSSFVLPLGTGAVSSIEAFQNLSTGSGDDTINFSTRGNDSVSTNGGNDTIAVGLGQDVVDGGNGDDLLIVDYSGISNPTSPGLTFGITNPGGISHSGFGNVSSNSASIVDSISFSNIERFLISGTELDDNITTGDGNDTIRGGAGNDFINAGAGVNSVDGGEGFDTLANADFSAATAGLSINNISNSVVLPLGTGAAISIEAFQNLSTGSGDDTINFTIRGNDSVSTNGGNDTIDAGLGQDIVDGGNGDDLLIVDYSGSNNGRPSRLFFGINNPGGISHSGSVGNYYSYNPNGGDYNNISFSNIERFLIFGTAGGDNITTGDGNDTIESGVGFQDAVNGGSGDDLLIVDYSDISFSSVSLEFSFAIANPGGTSHSGYGVFNSFSPSGAFEDNRISFSNIERFLISGTQANDNITTGDGNDTIRGGAGADSINAGAGNDSLVGGGGIDTLTGGDGNDIYTIETVGDRVVETNAAAATGGTDTVLSSLAAYTLTDNVENLTLTGGAAINGTGNILNNVITGNSAANSLNGAAGIDTLVGGDGSDTYTIETVGDLVVETNAVAATGGTDTVLSSLAAYTLTDNVENLTLTGGAAINGTGNGLNNLITGNGAANSLSGGSGNDTLNGGAGIDTLIGGDGSDTYTIETVGDLVVETNAIAATGGTDTVLSSLAAYTLTDNVENLTLTGGAAINGTGNILNNVLTGNSAANSLHGGAGSDTHRR